MTDKNTVPQAGKPSSLFHRVREIIEAARAGVERSVNPAQVVAYWRIGRAIVAEEQHGKRRADYGGRILERLSESLTKEYGKGYSHPNLRYIRQFFLLYPSLIEESPICHALRDKFKISPRTAIPPIRRTLSGESWLPGRLHPNLAWTSYRALLKVDDPSKRSFYEIEAIKNNWSGRELERKVVTRENYLALTQSARKAKLLTRKDAAKRSNKKS